MTKDEIDASGAPHSKAQQSPARPPSLVDRAKSELRMTIDCLQSIVDASSEEPREPDDADWRFRFLEAQRAAKCTLAELSSTTAERGAGRASIIQECADVVAEMRQSEAGIFDAAHSGQRGEDRSNALYDAYQAIRSLSASATAGREEKLREERNILNNSFGGGAFHDGMVRQRIEKIDAELAALSESHP